MQHRRSRILILEASHQGHHPSYVRWILDSGLSHAADIILAGRRELFDHPEIAAATTFYVRREIDMSAHLRAVLADSSPEGLVRSSWTIGRLYRKVCAELHQAARVDLVIVPYLDDCILGLALPAEAFDGVPWMAITMRTIFHYPKSGVVAPHRRFISLRRTLFRRILRQKSMLSTMTIDPTLAEYAKRSRDRAFDKLSYLPDPARLHVLCSSKVDARRRLAIPDAARVIALYGEITARKGVYALLDAAARAECSLAIHVLLAGRCAEKDTLIDYSAYRALRMQGRLHVLDGYVDDEHERLLLSAIDCMWLGYINFYGMSGILVLAGRHGIPVIGCNKGLIGHLIRTHDLGVIVDPGDSAEITAALNRLVNQPRHFENAGRRALDIFAHHDPEELKKIVVQKSGIARA